MMDEADITDETTDVTSELDAAATDEGAARRRLTAEEWREIEDHYEYGTLKTGEILEKYKITMPALSKHIRRAAMKGRLIKKGSKRHLLAAKMAAAVATKVEDGAVTVTTFESKRRGRIEQSRETLYLHSRNNQASLMKIQKAIADGAITPANADADIKALQRIEKLIEIMTNNRWRLLDIEKDVDEKALPRLQFQDLNQDELDEMASRESDDDDGDDAEDFGDMELDTPTS
jgi:hypothetical protein